MSEPFAIYEFTLTSEDAVAWESLPREAGGWLKAGVLGTILAGGFGVALLPETWTQGWRLIPVGLGLAIVLFGGWTAALTLRNYRRAWRRFPQPIIVRLEDWGDSLTVDEGGRVRHFALETFLAPVQGTAHVFLPIGTEPVILPRRAFEPGVLEALASRVEAAGEDPLEP